MPDFKAVVFAEGQLPLTVATPSAVKSAFDGQCWVMFFSYNVLRRKIYPTLLEPRTYVHYRISKISARPVRRRIAETTAL